MEPTSIILPLPSASDFQVKWERPNAKHPYTHELTVWLSRYTRMQLLDREESLAKVDIKADMERKARRQVFRHFYPKAILDELVELRLLAAHAPYSFETNELVHRLGELRSQFIEPK